MKEDFVDAINALMLAFGVIFGWAMGLGLAWTLYSLLWGAIAGRLPW